MARTTLLSFALVILIPILAFSQTPQLPDYSNWDKELGTLSAVHNGKNTSLVINGYFYEDPSKSARIIVLRNESQDPWLLFYDLLPHTADHQNEKINTHVFEYVNSAWVHVKDFSDSSIENRNKDISDFLKDKYGLEFK